MTAFLGDFLVKSYMRSSNTLSMLRCSASIFLKLPLKIQVMQRSLSLEAIAIVNPLLNQLLLTQQMSII